MSKKVFQSFQEFFSLTRPLSSTQRTKLLNSLPTLERQRLLKALHAEGWEDLFIRNELDLLLDSVKEDFGEDIILIRIQVLSGKVVKVKKSFWSYVNDIFSAYSNYQKRYIFEGIRPVESGDKYYLLVSSRKSMNG